MNTIKYLSGIGFFLLLISCGSMQNKGSEAQKAILTDLVTNKTFEIVANWANPLASTDFMQLVNLGGILPPGSNGSNISLAGNTNYLRFIKDSVAIELPFFGERRRGGGYSADGVISYAGSYNNYAIAYNATKQRYKITFNVKKNTEHLQFTIWLYENLKATIALNSSDRSFIDYNGKVTSLVVE